MKVAALIPLQIYVGKPPRAPEGFWFVPRLQPEVHCRLKMDRSVLAASHYIVLTIRRGFKLIKPLIFRRFFVFFKLPSFVKLTLASTVRCPNNPKALKHVRVVTPDPRSGPQLSPLLISFVPFFVRKP